MTRLRTLSDLQDTLDADHAWRVKELANYSLALKASTPVGQLTLVRAGVPLLYAHWEGFVKGVSLAYVEFVDNQRLRYDELSSCFVVFGVKRHLGHLSSSRKSRVNIEAVEFFMHSMGDRANLSLATAVSTDSNLSSSVFQNIALSLGVDPSPYSPRFNLIDESLLKRRNRIAHGEYLDLGATEYRALLGEVTSLMRLYKSDVLNAATLGQYRR